jgi:hypothetical protein
MRNLIDANLHRTFFRVNQLLYVIEPKERRHVSFPKRDLQYTGEEVHKLRYHPMRKIMEDTRLEELSKQRDPLHGITGSRGSLGRYIAMKTQPAATDVLIRRGVQKSALRILAERILEQHAENKTRLLLKRTKKRKHSFTEFISRSEMDKMTVDTLLEKLLKLVMSRKKFTHLIIKPVTSGGKIYDRLKASFTLL